MSRPSWCASAARPSSSSSSPSSRRRCTAAQHGRHRLGLRLPRPLAQRQRENLPGLLRRALPVVRAGAVPGAAAQRCHLAAPLAIAVRTAASPEERRRRLAAARGAGPSCLYHQRAPPGAARARRSAGGSRRRHHPGVRAPGRRRAGLHGLPWQSGQGGDGEAAAGVPAHVPPGMHRPVVARPLDMPRLPVQRLRTAAGPSSMTFFILSILLAVWTLEP